LCPPTAALIDDLRAFFERHADPGWSSIEDLSAASTRPRGATLGDQAADTKEYVGGHEVSEGYGELRARTQPNTDAGALSAGAASDHDRRCRRADD
jgi:hypothetical protein